MFIGMKPKPVQKETDPQHIERKTSTWRKLQQTQNRSELERDIAGLKQKVQETEGQDMRETIQDKINAWFVENRHPETGEYPDFPDTEDGGYVPSLSAAEYHATFFLSAVAVSRGYAAGCFEMQCTTEADSWESRLNL